MAKKSNPNFNRNIKVSESTIKGLRAGKTFQGNVAKFKASGMTTEQREAMNRFYGKSRVAKAFGSTDTSPKVSKPKAVSSGISAPRGASGPRGFSPSSKASAGVRSSSTNSFKKSAGSFVKNELLGVDDFSRAFKSAKKGNWGSVGKSLGEGAFEFGTTVAAGLAAAPTGGGSVAAKAALIAAKQGAKAGAKTVAKSATKGAVKGAAKSAAKAVATGSVKKGAGNVVRAAAKAPGAARGGVRSARGAVNAAKASMDTLGTQAASTARSAAGTKRVHASATEAYKKAQASHKAGLITAGELAAQKTSRDVARKAAQSAGARAQNAAAKVAARDAKVAARKGAKKTFRKGVRRAGYIRAAGAANTYGSK